MPAPLHRASAKDLPVLSELCLRAKGHWGMPPDQVEACRAELTRLEAEHADSDLIVANETGLIRGIAQLRYD